jgi:hypothetical protein
MRHRWNFLAWLVFLSVLVWVPLVLRVCASGSPRPAELES